MNKRNNIPLAHSHGSDPNNIVSDETHRLEQEHISNKLRDSRLQNSLQEQKDREMVVWIVKHLVMLILIIVAIIINDAFLLKYGASFTVSGTFMIMIEYARLGLQHVGFYLAKLANFAQLVWDFVDAIIDRVKEYLPLEQLAESRALAMNAMRGLFDLVSIGWIASILKGIAEGLKISPYLPISLAFMIVVTLYWKDIKDFVAKMNVSGSIGVKAQAK